MPQATVSHRRRAYLATPSKPASRMNRLKAMERISVSTDVYGDMDTWYGHGATGMLGLGQSASALRQPLTGQTKPAAVPVVSKQGMRESTARLVLLALVLVLCISLVNSFSGMKAADRKLTTVHRDISQMQQQNDDLRQQLQAKESGINVGYQAARMGLVSSAAVQTITIILSDAPMLAELPAPVINTNTMAILGD